MNYDYFCESCKEKWEENNFLNQRDLPLTLPCPKCGVKGSVKRGFFSAARISYDGNQTILQRAGSGWNDVLTKIKSKSARGNTIETR